MFDSDPSTLSLHQADRAIEHPHPIASAQVFTPLDRLIAACTGLIAFWAYLRTMYPGVVGIGDAAKFAFVGKVLGTPHPPGYPLYVLVSHVFSYVPWGTMAHRMNGLSALLAAAAVALAYALARALRMERSVAVATALALGFGHAFWSKAEYPKVYTLNAALVCAGTLLLVRWGASRRRALLYAAIACFGISTGNHLIIVSLLPALVAYALVVDPRTALAPRTLAIAALFLAIGFSEYLLILIRTWQNAPYLEARATNLRELVDVVTVRRWSQEIGAYTLPQVVHLRMPAVARLVSAELTVAGLVLAAVGIVKVFSDRWRDALLLVVGAAGVLLLTANMSSNEDEGFLLPAFLLLWMLAGCGLQWIVALLRRAGAGAAGVAGGRIGGALALLLAAALPVSLVATNYRSNDHHDRTFEIRYFDALFRHLPDRSAIIDDRYTINMMLKYKLLGEEAAAGRDIQIVLPDHLAVSALLRQGYTVFAFDQGRGDMEELGYELAPVQLLDLPLPDYLDTIKDGWTVAIGATADVAAELRSNRRAWRRLGVRDDRLFERKRGAPLAVIGVQGVRRAALEGDGAQSSEVAVARGAPIGDTGVLSRSGIDVTADRRGAAVTVDGATVARAASGAALVVIDPSGRTEAHEIESRAEMRVPFPMQLMRLYRITAAADCTDVGNTGWRDLSSSVTGPWVAIRIDNYRAFLSKTTLYVSGDRPAAPRLTLVNGRGTPRERTDTFRVQVARDRHRLEQLAAADGLTALSKLTSGSAFVSRYEVDVNDNGDHRAMRLDLGMTPAVALVRAVVDLNNPKRASVCGIPPATAR